MFSEAVRTRTLATRASTITQAPMFHLSERVTCAIRQINAIYGVLGRYINLELSLRLHSHIPPNPPIAPVHESHTSIMPVKAISSLEEFKTIVSLPDLRSRVV